MKKILAIAAMALLTLAASAQKLGRVIFTPDSDLKEELSKTAVQITCFDRDGKEVKRVTSTDSGDVEDPENDNLNGNQNGSNQNQGGNTSGDNGGGGNSGGSGGMVID